MKRLIRAVALLCFAAAAHGETVRDFGLIDADGRWHELYRLHGAKAVVVVGHGLNCPILERSAGALRELQARFAPRGVRFLFLNAFEGVSREELRKFSADFGLDVPILLDESGMVAKELGLTRTAEAAVVDPRGWRVAYRGPIDDRHDYLGSKAESGKKYLEDALAALLEGRPSPEAPRGAMGCLFPEHREPPPVYERDVAAAVRMKCAICHSPKVGVPPVELSTRKGLAAWASMARETVMTGRMPPFSFDPGYAPVADFMYLAPKEKRALARWLDAPQAEGPDPLPPVFLSTKTFWRMGFAPDVVYEAPERVITSTDTSVIYYTTLAGPLPRDMWVTEVSFGGQNPRVVQHTALYALPKPLESYDVDPRGDGGNFDALGEAFGAVDVGSVRHQYKTDVAAPEGSAWIAPKGHYLVLEQHFGSKGRVERSAIKVGLKTAAAAAGLKTIRSTYLMRQDLELAPRERKKYRLERRFDAPITLLGHMTHMHKRGDSALLWAKRPGLPDLPLQSIPRYTPKNATFRWIEPVELPAGSTIVAELSYDNTGENPLNPDPGARVKAGRSMEKEEMFKVVVHYK